MTVKISGTFPKDLLAFNGLEVHHADMVNVALEAGPDDDGWNGYVVARISVAEVTKKSSGEYVAKVQIEHIEVMEGPRVEEARKLLLATFRERTVDGVVQPTLPGMETDFLRNGTGLVVRENPTVLPATGGSVGFDSSKLDEQGYPRFYPEAELLVSAFGTEETWTGERWNEYVAGAELNRDQVTARLVQCPPSITRQELAEYIEARASAGDEPADDSANDDDLNEDDDRS